MAGLYPDTPSRRMAYDADGTLFGYYKTSAYSDPVEYSALEITERNHDVDDAGAVPDFNQYGIWVIFPELREFDGSWLWLRHGTSHTYPLYTSANSTNGVDGTFTLRDADADNWSGSVFDRTQHRTGITSHATSNVRAIRVEGPTGDFPGHQDFLQQWHIYGEISPGETPDRLLFIDEATGLEFTGPKDFAEIPRGGSEDFEWRIRNNSASLTANTIQYTTEALSLTSDGWYTYTVPGGAVFSSTQQIASLASSTTTSLITGRRVTPALEELGLHSARIYLNTASWS